MPYFKTNRGYTLIEMVVVLVIISIIALIALGSLEHISQSVPFEETREKMQKLANAIAGDPRVTSSGGRSDYGYVGDIGALPASWENLVTNPGYATWQGPYVREDFSDGTISGAYKTDAWGVEFSAPGISFSSTGSGETFTQNVISSSADLFNNDLTLVIYDINYSAPGSDYKDSLQVILYHPDGAGGTTARSAVPDAAGTVTFSNVPVGSHTLLTIYNPANDTLTRRVNINPGQDSYTEIQHYAELW